MLNNATAVETAPIKLQEKLAVNRDLTRYVFCIGDHIEPRDKVSLSSIGAYMGGTYIGASDLEGAPTMKRTRHFLMRGFITPLETTAYPKAADHRPQDLRDETYITMGGNNIRAYTVYPGDSINFLQSDRFRSLGIVELSQLVGKDWETDAEYISWLQKTLFPDMEEWLSGAKMPVLLSDYEKILRSSYSRIEESGADLDVLVTIDEALESVRLFRNYAMGHIERNRQFMLSLRSNNAQGFYYGWNEKSRLYARQLGVTLEDDTQLNEEKPSEATDLLKELKAERELRMRELDLREKELQLKYGINVPKPSVESVESIEKEPSLEEEDTLAEFDGQCIIVKKNGQRCRANAKTEDGKCIAHAEYAI